MTAHSTGNKAGAGILPQYYVLLCIATGLVSLRCYAGMRVQKGLGWDDITSVLALYATPPPDFKASLIQARCTLSLAPFSSQLKWQMALASIIIPAILMFSLITPIVSTAEQPWSSIRAVLINVAFVSGSSLMDTLLSWMGHFLHHHKNLFTDSCDILPTSPDFDAFSTFPPLHSSEIDFRDLAFQINLALGTGTN